MQQRLQRRWRQIAVWGWVGPAVLALILVSAVGVLPLYAVSQTHQTQPDPLSSPVGSPSPSASASPSASPTATVPSDRIIFTADSIQVKPTPVPAGAGTTVNKFYDLELAKEKLKCTLLSDGAATGPDTDRTDVLDEGPFFCAVKIKAGKLTGVNGPLTKGTASGTLEVSTEEDGDIKVAFVIDLSTIDPDTKKPKPEFTMVAGTETELGVLNRISGFDPKGSTVSVTPILDKAGDTSAFTLFVVLTVVESTLSP